MNKKEAYEICDHHTEDHATLSIRQCKFCLAPTTSDGNGYKSLNHIAGCMVEQAAKLLAGDKYAVDRRL